MVLMIRTIIDKFLPTNNSNPLTIVALKIVALKILNERDLFKTGNQTPLKALKHISVLVALLLLTMVDTSC